MNKDKRYSAENTRKFEPIEAQKRNPVPQSIHFSPKIFKILLFITPTLSKKYPWKKYINKENPQGFCPFVFLQKQIASQQTDA